MTLSLLFVTGLLSSVAMAAHTPVGNAKNFEVLSFDSSTRSYDSDFELDFTESSVWVLDFNNDSTLIFNHQNVCLLYTSPTPPT